MSFLVVGSTPSPTCQLVGGHGSHKGVNGTCHELLRTLNQDLKLEVSSTPAIPPILSNSPNIWMVNREDGSQVNRCSSPENAYPRIQESST
jgi:hypothetical protein